MSKPWINLKKGKKMNELASVLRFMQLYAHGLHNLCKGNTFFQDHLFFGELYPAYEAHYDDVVERMIGTGEKVDILEITKSACEELGYYKMDDVQYGIDTILQYEQSICNYIERLCEQSSEGTSQMLGDIANASEMRQYKMKQRSSK